MFSVPIQREHIMKARGSLAMVAAVLALAAFWLARPLAAEPNRDAGKAVYLTAQKIEESEAKGRLVEPHFGYVGDIGTFVATTKNAQGVEAHAAFVVHNFPEQENLALGCTKLKYQGPKHLGNVDGWVFMTEWNGKAHPSRVFLSAQKVYFGGGREGYIAADYREATGWAWKLIPLRRLELVGKGSARTGARSQDERPGCPLRPGGGPLATNSSREICRKTSGSFKFSARTCR